MVLENVISTKKVIDELTYASYAFNRKHSPAITPEKWGTIFDNVLLLEERFQKEV